MDWRGLLASFSVAILSVAVWGHVTTLIETHPIVRRLLLGVSMGLGAIGSMLLPLRVPPNLIYDLRTPLIACAGLIGGLPAGIVAALLAVSYRFHMGGLGTAAGSVNIILVASFGVMAHGVLGRRPPRFYDLPLVAGGVCCVFSLSPLLLPTEEQVVWLHNIGRFCLLNFICTWIFALSLRRDDRLRDLVETNGIYRAIIEALPDSLNAKDRESRFIAANPATAFLMRVPSTRDLVGRSDADFYPAAAARLFREQELMVLSNRTIGPIDEEILFADGSRRWLTSLKMPLRDRHGKISGIITHNRDITDRKQLESELHKAQNYLQEALTNMNDGLVVYDAQGFIRFSNQNYRNLFPATADLRVNGANFADIFRASVQRGERAPKADLDAWVARRMSSLTTVRDQLIALADGRIIEFQTRRLSGDDYMAVFADVTARKQLERDLQHRASHDPLTGLPNRAEFDFRFKAALERRASADTAVVVMMLDLDRFKQVNDTLGHAAGDGLLTEVAARLREVLRAEDLVARLGGDEFAIIVAASDIEAAAVSLAERLLSSLAQPFHIQGNEILPGGSLGMAFFPRDAQHPDQLLALADKALYDVKSRGGGGWAMAAAQSGLDDQTAHRSAS